ncbi:mechanosensitive ion channel family protein [Candidatus Xianfuyuplasma coldseepsis]|uniref:Mechanosensitive ion channel family protein n=1 Tax=Candidatus Xianfuyuplasma coldseepsis TaxID=2782163 RepID=A0A7L7KQT2_9MOLU|nr:mechanosensitive ion channel family protein [Xianfuyuplasma coldseepsis]QMS85037.1 mechanosensitive ion channel family protein [Xianfuyuplasma coldseepsis]
MNGIGEVIYNIFVNNLNIPESLSEFVIIGFSIVTWLLLGFIINRVSKPVINKLLRIEKKGARAKTVANLLWSVTRYLVWFIVLMLIFSSLGVDLTPFIASAGVVGLAIGFGAQEIVRDFMSGFFIIFDGEFQVGEVIEVKGFKGTVIMIGLRTTVIENWKGERKIINNGNIDSVINFSRNQSIAVVDFGVAYDTDLQKLTEIMPAFLEQEDERYGDIVEMPKFLGVTELADSSINMRIIAKTEVMKHFQVERDIRKDLVMYFSENEIEIPFPQVVVHNA